MTRISSAGIQVLVCLAALAGCYEPKLEDCTLSCGAGDACPSGQHCDHGFCSLSKACSPSMSAGGSSGSIQVAAYLKPEMVTSFAQFGSAVVIDGDTLAVGAPYEGLNEGNGPGAVYVFARQGAGWSQQQRLAASAAQDGDLFGIALALSGDTLIVGAPKAGPEHAGTVHVFANTGTSMSTPWVEQALLQPPNLESGDLFGDGVALSADTLVVGAPNDDGVDNAAFDSGAAYVFTGSGSTWTQTDYLEPEQPGTTIDFGVYVGLSGNTLAVGAPGYTAKPGLADVFARSGETWMRQAELSGTAAVENFGSVALDGDTLVVGASYEDSGRGAAYVFARSNGVWIQQAHLTASTPEAGAWFGTAVSLRGDTLFVGSHRETYMGLPFCGVVHTFRRTGSSWIEGAPVVSPNPSAGDRFGVSLSYDGHVLAVGAAFEGGNGTSPLDDSALQAGAAYVWTP
jgi:hypothetical protein